MYLQVQQPLTYFAHDCGVSKPSHMIVQECQHRLQLTTLDKEYLKQEVSNLESRLQEQQAQVVTLEESLNDEKARAQEMCRKLMVVRFMLEVFAICP